MMNCMELRKVLKDCFDELMKILISEGETDSRFCMLVKFRMSSRKDDWVLLLVAFQRVEGELKLDEVE